MERISYIGLKKLNAPEIEIVRSITSKEYSRILRSFKDANLIIEIKEHDAAGKAGKAKKYSIHMKVESPNCILTAEQADWDIARALHKTFNNLKNEINHRYKDEVTLKRKLKFSGKIF